MSPGVPPPRPRAPRGEALRHREGRGAGAPDLLRRRPRLRTDFDTCKHIIKIVFTNYFCKHTLEGIFHAKSYMRKVGNVTFEEILH